MSPFFGALDLYFNRAIYIKRRTFFSTVRLITDLDNLLLLDQAVSQGARQEFHRGGWQDCFPNFIHLENADYLARNHGYQGGAGLQ
jgi:hypothetical protein